MRRRSRTYWCPDKGPWLCCFTNQQPQIIQRTCCFEEPSVMKKIKLHVAEEKKEERQSSVDVK